MKTVINRIKCFFGFHEVYPFEVDYGEVPELLGKILCHMSLMIRAEYKNNHYIEYYRGCKNCEWESPRGYLKDIWDIKDERP
jgi:hypothetical protein